MKPVLSAMLLLSASVALSTDHNNMGAGRPLRFDDAYSIAFGERAFEFGISLDAVRRRGPEYGLKTEFKYGLAKNQDLGIAFEPRYATAKQRGDFGHTEVSYFHGLRREIGNQPALGYRIDVGLPTARDSRGADLRLRGILTKALRAYDRIHANLDVSTRTAPSDGERRTTFGAILGYSTPIGYPTRFDRTFVAQAAFEQSSQRSRGWTGSVGVGLRQQVGVRSVADIGIETDVLETKGKNRSSLRLTLGYSIGF